MRIGVDSGGTFTDFVCLLDGQIRVHKERSTPEDPSRAIVAGLATLNDGLDADVIHGATVATNALLERKGARLALFTTEGFEDILTIGRQNRKHLYRLLQKRPEPVVAPELCFGVSERTLYDGQVLRPLHLDAIEAMLPVLAEHRVESVAVCLLHSYTNPEHERRIGEWLRRRGYFVSISHEILPEYREFERCSTTTVNAYVSPLMERYLGSLGSRLGGSRLSVMQSNGGTISAGRAKQEAIRTILSGPAGGVIGALAVGELTGHPRIISFDMGGTSTDVALCNGAIPRTTESIVGDLPIRVPMIDIHTVGAGGGSLATIDAGGALRVGPQSAGADPGPICYGRGGLPTVTDANLILGRLDAESFLAGDMPLFAQRTREYFERFAREAGLTVYQYAEGILRVANANMERAIRVVSVERGFDPRDFNLVAFGGAGGVHAAEIADKLEIGTVIVPKNAGVLSALGMLLADTLKDYSRAVLRPADELVDGELELIFTDLEREGMRELRAEGFNPSRMRFVRSLDMRYLGQSFEVEVPYDASYRIRFDEIHRQLYGYSDSNRKTEVVVARVQAVGLTEKPSLDWRPSVGADASPARIAEREAVFQGRGLRTTLYLRSRLGTGNEIVGPAVVTDYDSTAVIPPGYAAVVDGFENLVMRRIERFRGDIALYEQADTRSR